ncbi:MAG: hypothetical protein ACHBN1_05010 [Heteroscytonema crispum UTEX LB 1556]
MSQSVKYVTNEEGKRVGVLLYLETYHQLKNPFVEDGEILTGLSLDELKALAECMLSPKAQAQLDDLLTRNGSNQLSSDETVTLDGLLEQVDQLNIVKTRARYTLNRLQGKSEVA